MIPQDRGEGGTPFFDPIPRTALANPQRVLDTELFSVGTWGDAGVSLEKCAEKRGPRSRPRR